MKRYNVPRVAFINKLDRQGSSPTKVIGDLRNDLKLNAAAVQIPVGLEDKHIGVLDIVEEKMFIYEGDNGEIIKISEIPDEYAEEVGAARTELLERVSEVDDEVAEVSLELS